VNHLRWLENAAARRRARTALIWSVVITLALYVIPFGAFIAYPLLLISTLFHELGHGIAAMLGGGSFDRFQMFADGSGVAQHHGDYGAGVRAFISAGGLVGPAVVAALAFVAGRSIRGSRGLLAVLAIGLAVAIVLVVRNPFGVVFTAGLVVAFGWLALRSGPETVQLATVLLATQLALSVFSRADYLFTDSAVTGAGTLPSDTAQIAAALGGPYWAWGLACGAFSLLVLAAGVAWFARVLREPARPTLRTRG
jgi:Peptidase M50B-like